MSVTQQDEVLRAARDALERHAWTEAYDALKEADGRDALPPESLEALGEASWWAGRHRDHVDAYERAFAAHSEAGRSRAAATVALKLVTAHAEEGNRSVAAGWLHRAIRLLDVEPADVVEHGYLASALGNRALLKGDLEEAVARTGRALELGMKHGDRDLQATALSIQGWAIVLQGRIDEGMALMEEATAAAVSGELGPRATGIVYCRMVSVCHDLGDYSRAGEWTEAAKRWCDRQAITGFPGVCRVHRAEIMRLRGAWAEAEAEARRASAEGADFSRGTAAAAMAEVGEVRLRMGDLAGAQDAFEQASAMGSTPEPGLTQLRLARGEVEAAVSGIRLALEAEWDPLWRARYLPVQVEAVLAAGDRETARAALEELDTLVERFDADSFRAGALQARGSLELAEGDPVEAGKSFREAVRLWRSVDAPYETSLAREGLGRAYLAQGDEADGALELRGAHAEFERLGAILDADRCRAALDACAPMAGLPAGASARAASRAEKTFMFTDIVGSTNLLEVIGDDAWHDLRRWHDQTLRALFAEHGGEEVDHTGDGFFAAFDAAGDAARCASAIQRRLAEHRRTAGFAPQVRIGLHTAEATRVGRNYSGLGVHQAARIGALAGGGEVLASAEAIEAAGPAFVAGESRTVTLKGIAQPVAVASIDWHATG